jgi:uncharacterized protein YjiS (DUF1127 family)
MESVMNTVNSDLRNLTVQTHGGLRWSKVDQQLKDWWHDMVSGFELESLDDRCLQDIGISRARQD